ncbi:hypothetical protein MHI32_09595 [Paenibacillus sp. FSL H7-0690]|jgi:hypothetical protein|uniref:hypothetical protein n=1 Tax=Paenibacillus sp. FSL H7-0690 TaxID=2921437 RepID=UPI0030ED32B3
MLVNRTKKQESELSDYIYEGIDFLGWSDDDKNVLFEERKDRKYAAFTVELCAIVEQLLKDIYEQIQSKPFLKYELERSLCSHLIINRKGSNLTAIRNYIVHDTFSMKRARKNDGVIRKYKNNSEKDIPDKSKKLYSELHENVVDYINGISYKKK